MDLILSDILPDAFFSMIGPKEPIKSAVITNRIAHSWVAILNPFYLPEYIPFFPAAYPYESYAEYNARDAHPL